MRFKCRLTYVAELPWFDIDAESATAAAEQFASHNDDLFETPDDLLDVEVQHRHLEPPGWMFTVGFTMVPKYQVTHCEYREPPKEVAF